MPFCLCSLERQIVQSGGTYSWKKTLRQQKLRLRLGKDPTFNILLLILGYFPLLSSPQSIITTSSGNRGFIFIFFLGDLVVFCEKVLAGAV